MQGGGKEQHCAFCLCDWVFHESERPHSGCAHFNKPHAIGTPALREQPLKNPLDAASVWAARSSLKPHFRDGLDASADSDYYVMVISLRTLFNKAGPTRHFVAWRRRV